MPDLRLSDLTKLGPCTICGKRQLEGGGLPLFYVVEISRYGFDAAAVRRAAGLEMQIGGPLAAAMGPDEPLAKVLVEPHRVFVHETCADRIAHLLQLMPEDKDSFPAEVWDAKVEGA